MAIQWPLVLYTLFTGLGVGAFAFVAVTEWLGKAERSRQPGAITALVALALGGVASLFHLGHPERFFNALVNLSSSIAQEMILTGLTALVILIYVILVQIGFSAQGRKIVATIGLVLAVILAIVLGNSYVQPSRPAWNTFLLPLLYLTSASVMGLFIGYLWTAVRKEETTIVMSVNKATLIALAIQTVTIVAYVIYLVVAPEASPARLLGADLALAFWGGVVVVGLVIPLGLTAWLFTSKKEAPPFFTMASVGLVCVLVGGIVTRTLLFHLGSSVALF
ncbi:MAG: polysulfide reductase NrfD [Anaerolineales bacterium]|nr:polysulfide reductase NrfD [Anaerolineales bacterium]